MCSINNKMSEYKCSICEYKSSQKNNVIRHINRQGKCGAEGAKLQILNIEIKCEFCEKHITLQSNLKKHLKICKVKKNNLEEELKKKENEILVLKTKLEAKPSTINNTQININLTAYNDPNLKGMEKYYLEAIKKAFLSVPHIIEKIHFNIEYPENQTIAIKNKRNREAKIFNGQKWTTINEDIMMDEIINNYEQLLENYAEDDPEKMRHIEKYWGIKERDSEEVIMKDLKDEVKRVIYDNSGMVKIR
jgi:hypothetical protein